MNNLTWIHLSDIHEAIQNSESTLMRDGLISKIKDLNKDYKFSFIVITGDIADKNMYNEEKISDFFDELLNATNIQKDNLFLVPGNHDLDRTKARESLLKGFSKNDEFDKSIIDSLKAAFNNFNKFYKNYFKKEYCNDGIHYVETRNNFNIVGLNTALASGYDKEEGSIRFCFDNVSEKLKTIESSNNISLAIGHHNVDCLHTKDRDLLIKNFETYNVDMYLSGHIHDSDACRSIDGNSEIPSVTCGATVPEGYGTTGFIIGKYNNNNIINKFFKWSEKNYCWIVDNEVNGHQNENGELYFSINKTNSTVSSFALTNEEININSDEFSDFIIDFHNNFENVKETLYELQRKDIDEKFKNMKCNKAMINQYDTLSMYFPIINNIMESSSYISPKNKYIIQNVVLEAYNKFLDQFNTGNRIFEEMIQYIYNNYKNNLKFSESSAKIYIKILCYWFIYECDIFDDKKD